MTALRRRALPLRVSLVAATLVLVAFGLLASGVAVTSIQRHNLINRADQSLLTASRSWAQVPLPTEPSENPNPGRPPSKFYVRGVGLDGRVWLAGNDHVAEPRLPENNDVGPEPVTLHSVGRSDVLWRAMTVHGPRGELITVATDLVDVQSTVEELIWAQAGIGAAGEPTDGITLSTRLAPRQLPCVLDRRAWPAPRELSIPRTPRYGCCRRRRRPR